MRTLEIRQSDTGIVTSLLGADGRPQIESLGTLPFENPLSQHARAELQWYLEEYPKSPFAAERDRAREIETRMERWGESIFEQVFPSVGPSPTPREMYVRARQHGLEDCEIVVCADADPETGASAFLAVPWELIRDPSGAGFLAPQLGSMVRRYGAPIRPPSRPRAGPFRILLVIARPYGSRDVEIGAVARPVLEALRPLRPSVELTVLRPPTLRALVATLTESRGEYDLVHFDGHGLFLDPKEEQLPTAPRVAAGQGHLVFETTEGEPELVSGHDLWRALATCEVPLFVLNACQSAQQSGMDAYSSVAAQLVRLGASGVVAMPYSILASAASLFMGRFYERLADHATLSAAVAAAREHLYSNPRRPSAVGELEFRDWVIPALYQQAATYTPIPRETSMLRAKAEEGERKKAAVSSKDAREVARKLCPEGRYGFIGRDGDILRLERLLRSDNSPWVVVSGVAGTGKTEFVYGFARWFAETNGCPGGLFVHTLTQAASLNGIMQSLEAFTGQHSDRSEQKLAQLLTRFLKENRCLLILDDCETLSECQVDQELHDTNDERDKIIGFLRGLCGGRSRVLIVTRNPNELTRELGCSLLELAGLQAADAGLLAQSILRSIGKSADDYRDKPEYSEVLVLLAGHPLTMMVALPLLRSNQPHEIVRALRDGAEPLGGLVDSSLYTSLRCVFEHLSPEARRHLAALSLFSSRFDAAVVARLLHFEKTRGLPVYAEVVGESPTAEQWRTVLSEAEAAGLVQRISESCFGLHPVMPSFLRQMLLDSAGESGLARLDEAFTAFYASWASTFAVGVDERRPEAIAAVGFEEQNLLRAVAIAEREQKWLDLQAIAQTLFGFYEARGREEERDSVRRRLLDAVGWELADGADVHHASLWRYLLGNEANSALAKGELSRAEEIHRAILAHLERRTDPEDDRATATAYHQLGIIAQERKRPEQAEQCFRKALAISMALGLEADVAAEYHHLGMLAQEQARYDEAEALFKEALAIKVPLRLEVGAAMEYHHLGLIAHERSRYDEAEAFFQRALEISERLGLEADAASEYLQLGAVALGRSNPEEAETWFKKALEIHQRLDREVESALDFESIGRSRLLRGQYAEALAWMESALAIWEGRQLPDRIAPALLALGITSHTLGHDQEARTYFGRLAAIVPRLSPNMASAIEYNLGSVSAAEHDWEEARRHLLAAAEGLTSLGDDTVAAVWRQLGRVCLRSGDAASGSAYLEKASALYLAAGNSLEATRMYIEIARAADVSGDRGSVRMLLTNALNTLRGSDSVVERAELAMLGASLAESDGDLASAEEERARALELLLAIPLEGLVLSDVLAPVKVLLLSPMPLDFSSAGKVLDLLFNCLTRFASRQQPVDWSDARGALLKLVSWLASASEALAGTEFSASYGSTGGESLRAPRRQLELSEGQGTSRDYPLVLALAWQELGDALRKRRLLNPHEDDSQVVSKEARFGHELECYREAEKLYAEVGAEARTGSPQLSQLEAWIRRVQVLASLGAWDRSLSVAQELHGFLRQLEEAGLFDVRVIAALKARLFLEMAQLMRLMGDYQAAAMRARDAKRQYSMAEDHLGMGMALVLLAVIALHTGDIEGAREATREAMQLTDSPVVPALVASIAERLRRPG